MTDELTPVPLATMPALVNNVKNYDAIPRELKNLPVWCTCGMNTETPKRPYKPVIGFLQEASSTDPSTWGTFADAEEIVRADRSGRTNLGFMLRAPYVVIDFDDPKPKAEGVTDEEYKQAYTDARNLQKFISSQIPSYQEKSVSGKGLHIIGKADAMPGRKVSTVGIEIYTKERFIICTGDVYINKPLAPIDTDWLVSLLPISSVGTDFEVKKDDRDPIAVLKQVAEQHGYKGSTYEKIMGEYKGPFESEDTGKFMVSLAVECRTRDPELLKELFFASTYFNSPLYALHLRGNGDEKANNSHRLRKTSTHWDREASTAISKAIPMIAIKESEAASAAANVENLIKASEAKSKPGDNDEPLADVNDGDDSWKNPPGVILQGLTDFFFEAAIVPNRRVSATTAIALMSGWVGGRYITDTNAGLTFYGLLLGSTSSGKGDVTRGYNFLKNKIAEKDIDGSLMQLIMKHECPEDVTGRTALMSRVSEVGDGYSQLQIVNEIGAALRGSKTSTINGGTLSDFLLKAFDYAGPNGSMGGKGYADVEKTVESVNNVNHCFLGESTHSTVYENLTLADVQSGFLPRFYIIPCGTARIKSTRMKRESCHVELSDALFMQIRSLLLYVDSKGPKDFVLVSKTVAMQERMDKLDDAVDDWCHAERARSGHKDTVETLLKNRYYFMVERLSTLSAVSRNYLNPIVEEVDVDWAINFVDFSYATSVTEFNLGSSDIFERQEAIFADKVREYFHINKRFNGKRSPILRRAGIVELTPFCTNAAKWAGYTAEGPFAKDRTLVTKYLFQCYTEDSAYFRKVELAEAMQLDPLCSKGTGNKWQLTAEGIDFFKVDLAKTKKLTTK